MSISGACDRRLASEVRWLSYSVMAAVGVAAGGKPSSSRLSAGDVVFSTEWSGVSGAVDHGGLLAVGQWRSVCGQLAGSTVVFVFSQPAGSAAPIVDRPDTRFRPYFRWDWNQLFSGWSVRWWRAWRPVCTATRAGVGRPPARSAATAR
jgi:hypothetical protein